MKRLRLTLAAILLLGFVSFSFSAAQAAKTIVMAVYLDNPDYASARRSFKANLEKEAIKVGMDVNFIEINTKGDKQLFLARLKELEPKADIIFTTGTPNSLAIKAAGITKPVVFSAVANAVGAKLVKSNEVPGTNFTGCTCAVPASSQLRALLLVLPQARRIGILYNPNDPAPLAQVKGWRKAVAEAGLKLVEFPDLADVQSEADLAEVTKNTIGKADVIVTTQDAKVSPYGKGMIKVANQNNLPTYASLTQLVKKGALVSLGFNFPEAARIVNVPQAIKILQGGNPAVIPVQTFPEYKLVINLKTARQIGINVPPRALRAASEVIK